MLAAVYYFGGGRLFWAVLLADGVHELGHLAALRLCGLKLRVLRLRPGGAVIDCEAFPDEKTELICVAAGPLAGLLLALVCLAMGKWTDYLTMAAILSTAFNLLPALPLDGGRLVRLFAEQTMSAPAVETLLLVSGCLSAGALAALGLVLHCFFVTAAGIFLAALVIWPELR